MKKSTEVAFFFLNEASNFITRRLAKAHCMTGWFNSRLSWFYFFNFWLYFIPQVPKQNFPIQLFNVFIIVTAIALCPESTRICKKKHALHRDNKDEIFPFSWKTKKGPSWTSWTVGPTTAIIMNDIGPGPGPLNAATTVHQGHFGCCHWVFFCLFRCSFVVGSSGKKSPKMVCPNSLWA